MTATSSPVPTVATPRSSVLASMAARYGMEPAAFEATLRGTVVPAGCTKEQFAAFLLVAKEYNLNPITKEIYAFPAKSGGIQPIVSIDGWMNLINSHPQMDGLEFEDRISDDGKLVAITARIWRKDRTKPITVTEYMSECRRDTPTWKQWPARMLRHKAAIQAARYAFGFSGLVEPDEYERGSDERPRLVPPPAPPRAAVTAAPPAPKAMVPPSPPPPSPQAAAAPTPSAPDADGPIEAEALLAHIDDELGACGDSEALHETWEGFADLMDRLTRSQREAAHDLFERHERRIEKAAS